MHGVQRQKEECPFGDGGVALCFVGRNRGFCRGDKPAEEELARKAENIENGLVELDLAKMSYTRPEIRMALAERMVHYKVPGVSIAVIEDGKLEWANAYGVMNVESGAAVTTESLFEAASTTKLLSEGIVLRSSKKNLPYFRDVL